MRKKKVPLNYSISPCYNTPVLSKIVRTVHDSAAPAIVHIETSQYPDIHGHSEKKIFALPLSNSNSGVIISKNGYILTSTSMLSFGNHVTAYMRDGKVLSGTIVGKDASLNLALIKVNATNLPFISLSRKNNSRTGDLVVALGNPTGAECTISAGMINGYYDELLIGRSRIIRNLIQTDAAINVTNIGGPLLNLEGQLIGINSFRNQGIHFCSDLAKSYKSIKDMIHARSTFLEMMGIRTMDVVIDEINRIWFCITNQSAVKVISVATDGIASQCGMRPGDTIISLDSIPIEGIQDLRKFFADKTLDAPVSIIKMNILRKKKMITINIKLSRSESA